MQQIDKYQRSKDARILEKFHHFQAYGEGLVQGFTKACQAELESHEEKLKRAAKDVKDSEKKLKSAKEVVKTWQREQEKMFVDIQALMAEGGE